MSLSPNCASKAKYGKLLTMKKSTTSTIAVMFPELCQPKASSDVETGMSDKPAAANWAFIRRMYFARLSAEPKSLSNNGLYKSKVSIYV